MKRFTLFGPVALVLPLIFGGCTVEPRQGLKPTESNLVRGIMPTSGLKITTSGCHSYLELNIWGNPKDHLEEILSALEAFENRYKIKIPAGGWRIERDQETSSLSAYIHGLWIDACLPPYESPHPDVEPTIPSNQFHN